MSSVDVIILNYNGSHFLRPCLSSLRAQSYRNFKVLLVDNASSDDSLQIVRDEYPEVEILALPNNYGFCAGNNRGIEATSGDYVALLNNDTEVSPGWLDALVRVLDQNPQVGFCASKLVRMSDRTTIDSAGDVFYTSGIGGKRGNGEPSQRYPTSERVFGACAGAAIYRRTMLDDIGLLDEDFFSHDEDVDLSFRAQLRGYACQFVPEAVVYHHVSGSFGRNLNRVGGRGRRNMLEVLLKNMPARLLLKHGPRIAFYYIAGDLYYILKGYGRMVLQARSENLRRLPNTLAKRRAIQSQRTVSSQEMEQLLLTKPWNLRKFFS